MNSRPRVVVTGATGYIGRSLIEWLHALGYPTLALGRRSKAPGAFSFSLGDAVDPKQFSEDDVIVHLASACMNADADPSMERLDVEGTQKLLMACRLVNVKKFIFISSQSAAKEAPTAYGRSKWKIEQLLTKPNEIIVRPGLVYGGDRVGLYGLLSRLISALPVFFDFGLDRLIQPIHISELCRAIEKVISDSRLTTQFNVGSADGISFKRFLRDFSHYRFNKKIHFIPLSYGLIRFGCALTHWVPFVPKISIDRVRGLLELNFMETRKSLSYLNLTLQEPTHFFSLEKKRMNGLEQEAMALFRSLGCSNPPELLAIQYARVMKLKDFKARRLLPRFFLRFPVTFRFFEPIGNSPLFQRMNIACGLLESFTGMSDSFLNRRRKSQLSTCFCLLGTLFVESIFVAPRWVIHKLVGSINFRSASEK